MFFQNFSLDKGICLTFIKKKKKRFFYIYISLPKKEILIYFYFKIKTFFTILFTKEFISNIYNIYIYIYIDKNQLVLVL